MVDVHTKAQRSFNMSRIANRDTAPERALRSALHRAGLRFRLHRRDLPGRPDIVLPSRRLAIFVHGCFWHRHEGCRFTTTPATNAEFWQRKFASNTARDAANVAALESRGWRVFVAWECEVRTSLDAVVARILSAAKQR